MKNLSFIKAVDYIGKLPGNKYIQVYYHPTFIDPDRDIHNPFFILEDDERQTFDPPRGSMLFCAGDVGKFFYALDALIWNAWNAADKTI